MTHDELLISVNMNAQTTGGLEQNTEALRAIVELHKKSVKHKDIPAGICLEDGEKYPCPTIQAIEEQLK